MQLVIITKRTKIRTKTLVEDNGGQCNGPYTLKEDCKPDACISKYLIVQMFDLESIFAFVLSKTMPSNISIDFQRTVLCYLSATRIMPNAMAAIDMKVI